MPVGKPTNRGNNRHNPLVALSTVTHDLLERAQRMVGDRPSSPHQLLVTYARVPDRPGTDPRTSVLRPAHVWRLPSTMTLGAGRAPSGVDAALPLVEENGRADETVPRLAVRLTHQEDTWWVTNHASGSSTVLITAPATRDELASTGPAYAVRRRRLILTVFSRSDEDDGPVSVEHRLTVLAPWIPDDIPPIPRPLPSPATASSASSASSASGDWAEMMGRTMDRALTMNWTWAQQRLLAAWAYPELIGLPPRTMARERLTRLLLRQVLAGKDPNERILSRLRRKASDELGVPLTGEVNTPAFLSYLVARRGFLGEALAALHAEYDAMCPGEPAGVTVLRG